MSYGQKRTFIWVLIFILWLLGTALGAWRISGAIFALLMGVIVTLIDFIITGNLLFWSSVLRR